ncbi:MAG: hypothetical protein ACOCU6_01140 [Nanoarchaeota archaeon]
MCFSARQVEQEIYEDNQGGLLDSTMNKNRTIFLRTGLSRLTHLTRMFLRTSFLSDDRTVEA